jgi:hypothetical protein
MGGNRFELTGPSILSRVYNVFQSWLSNAGSASERRWPDNTMK